MTTEWRVVRDDHVTTKGGRDRGMDVRESASASTTPHIIDHGDHHGESGDVEVASYLEESLVHAEEQPLATHPSTPLSEDAQLATHDEMVVILDFGSQFSRLIARRVREAHVFCELLPADTPWAEIAARRPKGIILSGGPSSVYDPGAPLCPPELLAADVPTLGICYGMQAIAYQLGGTVEHVGHREYGPATLRAVEVGQSRRQREPTFRGVAVADACVDEPRRYGHRVASRLQDFGHHREHGDRCLEQRHVQRPAVPS